MQRKIQASNDKRLQILMRNTNLEFMQDKNEKPQMGHKLWVPILMSHLLTITMDGIMLVINIADISI